MENLGRQREPVGRAWWVGDVVVCSSCKTRFRLTKGDKLKKRRSRFFDKGTSVSRRGWDISTTWGIRCSNPECDHNIFVRQTKRFNQTP